MPVNSSHAYGKGKIYKYIRYILFIPLFKIIFNWIEFIHSQLVWNTFMENSIIGHDCHLGPNAWCVNLGKREDIQIGNRVYCRGLLRSGTRGRGKIIISDEVYIGDDSIISSESCVEIGQLTMISHGVHIFDTSGHPTDPLLRELDWRIAMGQMHGARPEASSAPIRIGKRVWIGFNAILIRGVTIGDNAIVAAGSVVVHDVEPNTIVAGNPARVVKTLPLESLES